MKNIIRVGSRDSKLAVLQTQIVIDEIERTHPDIECQLITMKTTGDLILDRTLDKIGGKGLFVKELDRALADHRVDITVHSLKDLPMEQDKNLPIVALSARENPFDALVLPANCADLDFSKPIGCAGARRRIQLMQLFPNCNVQTVRGNVITRLQKLDQGEYSALVLAVAGLERLGLHNRISRVFSPSEMLPSAGQGVLAVQARSGFLTNFLHEFHNIDAYDTVTCERAFVKTLDGGCSSPVAAYGILDGESITLTGLYVNSDEKFSRASITGNRIDGESLGRQLALTMKERGC